MTHTIHKHNVPYLLGTQLLYEREFDIAVGRIYENGVFHLYFFSGAYISMDFIEIAYQFNLDNGGKVYRNLFEFEPHVDLDPEVRNWASSPNGNLFTTADALVISSLAHKLLANFYLKYNKPVKPTRIFNQQEKALKWLLEQ